jgi:hypothetical protein
MSEIPLFSILILITTCASQGDGLERSLSKLGMCQGREYRGLRASASVKGCKGWCRGRLEDDRIGGANLPAAKGT